MNSTEKKVIQKATIDIINAKFEPVDVLPYLSVQLLISDDDVERIRQEPDPKFRVSKFLTVAQTQLPTIEILIDAFNQCGYAKLGEILQKELQNHPEPPTERLQRVSLSPRSPYPRETSPRGAPTASHQFGSPSSFQTPPEIPEMAVRKLTPERTEWSCPSPRAISPNDCKTSPERPPLYPRKSPSQAASKGRVSPVQTPRRHGYINNVEASTRLSQPSTAGRRVSQLKSIFEEMSAGSPLGMDMEFLLRTTNFSPLEIRKWFADFRKECPQGLLTREQFQKFYRQLDPEIQLTDEFCDQVFRVIDTDKSESIDFKEFLQALNMKRSGTPSEKLEWTFQLYDIDNNGYIDLSEMIEIIKMIFGMLSPEEAQDPELISPEDCAVAIFCTVDLNRDKQISKEEFVSACLKDKYLYHILTASSAF